MSRGSIDASSVRSNACFLSVITRIVTPLLVDNGTEGNEFHFLVVKQRKNLSGVTFFVYLGFK